MVMSLTAQLIPILSDNYAWLLRDSASGAVAVVDPADPAPIIAAIIAEGGRLDTILLTHHHADHVAGTDEVRARFGAKVVGAAADAHRLPRLDQAVSAGDTVTIGHSVGQVSETPGHTIGHISYYFPDGGVLLAGDTLFSLGCGRLLEGTAADMFASLQSFALLPDETLVCCGHEYTESNAKFALHADPDNAALRARAEQVKILRQGGKPTLPSLLGDEKRENPFLRAPTVAALGELRARKDRF
jgi:hydroxyacylglutathione hydrolase